MPVPTYVFISRKLSQIENLYKFIENNPSDDSVEKKEEIVGKCFQEIEDCIKNYFPSGSGFDSGTKLREDSTPEKLRFQADFHHMDENGYYDGWTEHQVIITPCLKYGYSIRITGRNKKQIKDYLYDLFDDLSIN